MKIANEIGPSQIGKSYFISSACNIQKCNEVCVSLYIHDMKKLKFVQWIFPFVLRFLDLLKRAAA
ncbi:hypothetical protein ACH95_18440 [Bacillus glycinifermentans]|uniref:Uncharacterized protein n=1 Tax=Bacillus glycinifermentans TaxID=1664069 RepID=A0A0J6H9P4_9BACI|nr:hypothetical protein COP00_04160 [Bacillus glycinifermentans]KMM55902.1 hypothetical protein ACH95_18440 [Bacillus glycinifermentans]KRT92862.1 hypothetical protein AB447_221495 [Bacillus glycinifermentans]